MKETRSYNNNERVAVVTGSSKGIGKATAIEFANARYSVVTNARDETELKQAAEDISKFIKVKDIPYQGDISQEQVYISLIEEAAKKFGRMF